MLLAETLAANYKPVIRGTDHGIWQRIRLIPYALTIPQEQRDKKLKGRDCKVVLGYVTLKSAGTPGFVPYTA